MDCPWTSGDIPLRRQMKARPEFGRLESNDTGGYRPPICQHELAEIKESKKRHKAPKVGGAQHHQLGGSHIHGEICSLPFFQRLETAQSVSNR